MKTIIAIDPGAGGGIAWRRVDGIVECEPMPDGMAAICDSIRVARMALGPDVLAIVERTGTYMPGNSAVAACTFSRHCGHIEAALYCYGIATRQVVPCKWQKALGTWPKDKADRKRAIRNTMASRYPHLSVTLKTADALGLLTWAIDCGGEG